MVYWIAGLAVSMASEIAPLSISKFHARSARAVFQKVDRRFRRREKAKVVWYRLPRAYFDIC